MSLTVAKELWDFLSGPARPITVLFAAVFGAITTTQGILITSGLSSSLSVERQQLIVTGVVAVTLFVALTYIRLQEADDTAAPSDAGATVGSGDTSATGKKGSKKAQ